MKFAVLTLLTLLISNIHAGQKCLKESRELRDVFKSYNSELANTVRYLEVSGTYFNATTVEKSLYDGKCIYDHIKNSGSIMILTAQEYKSKIDNMQKLFIDKYDQLQDCILSQP